tara:strand:- start:777 stop:1022 length:246 start_codon:yes stop_codon:yes gene_type:complete
MGKMSEIHIKMLEEDFHGDPDAYLKAYADSSDYSPTDIREEILCPNCFKDKLVRINKVDMSCMKCGHDFVYIETHNAVKFK